MDTATAPIDNQAQEQNDSQQAPNISQPAQENNVAPLNPLTGDVAATFKNYDIKGANLTELGLDPLSGKYNTVADLEKAYSHLHSKFGGFSGAPEEYTVPEGAEVGEWFTEWGKEHGLNQEGFESLVAQFSETQQAQQDAAIKEEYAKLGKNADARIDSLRDWGNANNIDQGVLDSMLLSAAHVEALENIMSASGIQAPAQTDAAQPAITNDYLQQITYAKDDYGRLKTESDPEYAKFVQEQWGRKR